MYVSRLAELRKVKKQHRKEAARLYKNVRMNDKSGL